MEADLDASLVNLNEVLEKFTHALKPSGASLRRLNGTEFHDWLLDFFHPMTGLFDGDRKAFGRAARRTTDCPTGISSPRACLRLPAQRCPKRLLVVGESALRCVSIDGIRRRPFVGHVTGETNAAMRPMPEWTCCPRAVCL